MFIFYTDFKKLIFDRLDLLIYLIKGAGMWKKYGFKWNLYV